MNLKLFLGMMLILLLCNISSMAQKTVSGTVTDSATSQPLQGVSVVATGTSVGTTTDSAGHFTLRVPENVKTVSAAYVGYTEQTINIGNGGDVFITLAGSTGSLNDVVVVAYGTRKKGDLTGAVSSISAKDFQKGNIGSADQLLQGKVSGLQVTSGGGSPGGGSRIRIRSGASLNASNDPLIVIDGVPVEGNSVSGTSNLLNTINPNDIESISVLKDASATSLYGSRASNGVIIITTKKGAAGNVKFNFNTQASNSEIYKKLDVLTANQVRDIVNAQAEATGITKWQDLLGTANTDWQDQIFHSAMGYDNNLSASGAIGKVLPFRASVGYYDQDGILKTSNFKRTSAALNLTPKFLDNHLAVNISLKYSNTKNRFANEGAVGAAASFDPTQPVYDSENKYGGYFEWMNPNGTPIDLATRNPLALLELRNNRSTVNRIIGNVQLDYKMHFLPDLHLLVNVGIDNASGKGNDITDSASASTWQTAGSMKHYEQKKKNTLADVSLFYEKNLPSIQSKFDVLVGHSYQDFLTNVFNFASFSQRGTGPNDTIPNSVPVFATDKPRYRLESYLARINYTFMDKYLLTASLRRDASSKFSKDNRVGYFPSAAFAWKLKEEFFKNVNAINELKLRIGYGTTGQQDGIDYYSYLPYYAFSSNTAAQYQLGDVYYGFLSPVAYDINRKWEQSTTTNIGLDFAFANNRINGSVEYYYKKTKDLLSVVNIAPGQNFDIQLLKNVGNMENKGVEFTLNTTPVKTKDFSWDLGFNVTWQESNITNLTEFSDPDFPGITTSGITGGTGNNIGKFAVGYTPYAYYMYKQVYDPATELPIQGLFEDINRDGSITDADRYYYKSPLPDVLMGVNLQFTYRKWSLGFTGHGSFGQYLYNNVASNLGTLSNIHNANNIVGNASSDYLNTLFSNNQYLSDYYIQNASFFRWDNINLGFNAGNVFNNKVGLRVMATVQNVLLITKYKGLDPESANSSGVDYTIYPRPRIYSLGVNLDF